MNTPSFEQQLQQTSAPAPDPAGRLRARRAALAEFERVHAHKAAQGTRPRWLLNRVWLGGFATACVALFGVAIIWRIAPEERAIETTPAAATKALAVQPEQSAPAAQMSAAASTAPVPAAQLSTSAKRASPTIRQHVVDKDSVAEQAVPTVTDQVAPPSPTVAALTVPSGSGEVEQVTVTGSRIVGPNVAGRFTGFLAASPLVTVAPAGGDQFAHFDTNPVKRTADEPVSTFSVDVDTASYSFTRRMLNEGGLPPQDAVRIEEMINYFDYAWPAPESRQQPLRPTVTVSDSPWGAGKKLIHIGIKGYELPPRGKPDVNLVLLLDVSGSMNEPDKLPLAKRAMALLLDSLKPTDTVSIVVYAGDAGQVLAPTPVRDRETIQLALDSLRPGGSTAGALGIQLAYELAEKSFRKDGVNRILLATDGDFNVGVSDPDSLKSLVERERVKGIYLSVLGFGEGNYHDATAQTLAQNGNGVAAYIDTLNEARKVLVKEATSTLFTIASDVKIQVEFNPATVAEYRLVGYETRALNREDFNNDKVDAGDVGAGHAVTAIYEITPPGAGAKLIDERRYAQRERAATATARGKGEYGFVKIRYKLPGEAQSRLLEQPIRQDAGVPAALRQDVTFATAVAGFAQLLRGGRYTGELRYEDVIRAAGAAIGPDPYGYRAEFTQLARKARDARVAPVDVSDR